MDRPEYEKTLSDGGRLWTLLCQAPTGQVDEEARQMLCKASTKEEKLDVLQELDKMDNTRISSFIKALIPALLTDLTGKKHDPISQEEMNKWKMG